MFGIDMPPLLCTNYKFFTVFHRLYSKTQQWFNSLFLSGYQGILEGLDVISIGVSHPEFLMFQPNMLEHVGNDATSRGVCYDNRPRALRTPLPGSRHRLDCVWPVGPLSKLNWARELCTSCTQLAQNVSKILHICVQSLQKVSVLAPQAHVYEPTNTIAEIATALSAFRCVPWLRHAVPQLVQLCGPALGSSSERGLLPWRPSNWMPQKLVEEPYGCRK